MLICCAAQLSTTHWYIRRERKKNISSLKCLHINCKKNPAAANRKFPDGVTVFQIRLCLAEPQLELL